jgi:hypothetical protein
VQSPVSEIPRIHTERKKIKYNNIYYINQSTSLRLMLGTSPTRLNQAEGNRLAATSCKRGELRLRRQLEHRKSSSPPIRRCRSRSPAVSETPGSTREAGRSCQLPNKEAKAVYDVLCRIYSFCGCRRLKQSSEATFKVSRDMQ